MIGAVQAAFPADVPGIGADVTETHPDTGTDLLGADLVEEAMERIPVLLFSENRPMLGRGAGQAELDLPEFIEVVVEFVHIFLVVVAGRNHPVQLCYTLCHRLP